VDLMNKTGCKTIFVTGTGTAVGKTYVCARLLEFITIKGMQAGYQKWVATGAAGDIPEDLVLCLAAAGISPARDQISEFVPYSFRFPASPHLAAEMENKTIQPEIIEKNYQALADRYEWLIVEGVGGIMVPLQRNLLLVDMLARLELKTLIVARSGLGTLNHTLLTLEALRARKVPVLGVVFSDSEGAEDEILVKDNLQTVAQIGRVRVFGRLQRLRNKERAARQFVPVGEAILQEFSRKKASAS
jgi:dethiobiotin synthetase